jgi:hypothetical protein
MPTKISFEDVLSPVLGLPECEFEALIRRLTSKRKPRRIVIPSGRRARGNFPSLKSHSARFESLVEEDAWRVAEVSTLVTSFTTHNIVLSLPQQDRQGTQHYTADACFRFDGRTVLVEVKGDWLIRKVTSRTALLNTLRNLKNSGVPLALLSESDVRSPGLQAELKELLRIRPSAGLRRRAVDPTIWDPLGYSQPDALTLRRWRDAQKACDELLDRVMRRDPGEYVESFEPLTC